MDGDFQIIFRQSAFRHNVSEPNIRHAFMNHCYDGPIEDNMETMTEEEAFALDEYYTNNPPKVDPSKARIRIPMVRIDSVTADYIAEQVKVSHKKPEEILGLLVREKLAATL